MSDTYILEMTPETARIITKACELYARTIFGQVETVVDTIAEGIPLDRMPPHGDVAFGHEWDEWLKRREEARIIADQIKRILMPEIPVNGSYGVGHHREADIAWEAYEVLRYTMAWHNHPEGGVTVNFYEPMKLTDEPLPKCRVEEKE